MTATPPVDKYTFRARAFLRTELGKRNLSAIELSMADIRAETLRAEAMQRRLAPTTVVLHTISGFDIDLADANKG
jgi:hypothetical protein